MYLQTHDPIHWHVIAGTATRQHVTWGGTLRLPHWTGVRAMTVDPGADRAVYKQLADLIRNQIKTGELRPGQRLPAQKDYMAEYGISRDSVDRAMHVLRSEGLIVTSRKGSHVRIRGELTALRVAAGRISARMPSDHERRALGVAEGVPLLVVELPDGSQETHPADRTIIEVDVSLS
jgi:DNA-binding GntR family transcriptional regulator